MRFLERTLRRLRYGRPIVVVSGLPRSGTSMAMKMLHAGGLEVVTDGIRQADDSNPKGYFELEAVKTLDKKGDTAWLRSARGKGIKIVSSLLTYLPEEHEYQVIFMRRDLDEVLASQNKMLVQRGEAPGTPEHDARVREYYEQHLAQVQRFLARRPCFSVLWVDYRGALERPHEEASRMNEFLGRTLDVTRMAEVGDPALYRNRMAGGRTGNPA
jgi:hypothetical protein